MQTVVVGGDITFSITYLDSLGDPIDPPDVVFKVVKNATDVLSGPYSYSNAQVERSGVGVYNYSWTTSQFIVPTQYQVRWEATVEGEETVFFETFQILDPPVEAISLTDAPRLYGVIKEIHRYGNLGIGLTDRLCLVGHATGIGINNPFQVVNIQEAINALGGREDSPMIRALLEAYNNGAKDIWLVASAPEIEFVPFTSEDPEARLQPRAEWGGLNFYERYDARLEVTYSVLREYDFPEIIVPVDASFGKTGGVDFLTPLVNHCADAFTETGSPRIGILGTRLGEITTEDIQELIDDPRMGTFGPEGKFSMVVIGEGVFSFPQMPRAYTGSISVIAAATLATSDLDVGLTYRKLRNVISPFSRILTKDEIKALCAAKLNPMITTAKGRRGQVYQSILASDNTCGESGSDFWSIVQMRLVVKVLNQIRAMGYKTLGTIGFMQLKSDIDAYLANLVSLNYIRDYQLDIYRDTSELNKAIVELALKPYFGVRELFFTVEVGPGG